MATQNKTRPSCARVKVEVDLMGDFPNRINVGVRKKTWEVVEKWLYPREEKEGNLGKLAGEKKEELERRSKVKENMVEHKGILITEEGDKYHNRCGKREHVWHPRRHPAIDQNAQTHNMYEDLGENKE
ncbi:hypothetical protein H5410_003633 [Solanum commersonii]|uniref:Uncharacterized protein n=1 Tax=Solanum commersonii TaxID=4109 RepID=A0A9J6B5P9_SOLCO|nr:hypothetical protein H5410_003633 [Solanum commersonii]